MESFRRGRERRRTIPIGKIGNDRAISVVNERWYSSDLQMLIKSTSSDPRFGETTYQLTSVVQASPDPTLFSDSGRLYNQEMTMRTLFSGNSDRYGRAGNGGFACLRSCFP